MNLVGVLLAFALEHDRSVYFDDCIEILALPKAQQCLRPGYDLTVGVIDQESPGFEGVIPRGKVLYCEHANTKTRIRSLKELTGFVRITSAKCALDFVRLRTGFDTWYCFDSAMMEVYAPLKPRNQVKNGFCGQVWDGPAREVAKTYPRLFREDGSYRIERLVIVQELPAEFPSPAILKEVVSLDGGYQSQLVRDDESLSKLSTIDWIIPFRQ